MPFIHRFLMLGTILSLVLSTCSAPKSPNTTTNNPELNNSNNPNAEKTFLTSSNNISGKLIVYSGRSEPLIQPVIDAFQANYPQVEILLKAGSNSELANALIEEIGNPQADVFITTELFTVQTLVQQGIFQPYRSTGVEQLPADMIGPDNQWVGLTRRARVIMYNTNLVSAEELPDSIFDLTDPKWRGQVAAAGSTNGSMQAQIAAMRLLIGEEATQTWLKGLIDNEVTFFGGHTDVRKAVAAGEFKLGLVNHYYYHLQQAEGSPVGIIFPDQDEDQIGLFTNATSAAIVKDAKNLSAAQVFIDFLVSAEGQNIFAMLNYEYPALASTPLREGVEPLAAYRFAAVDTSAAALAHKQTFALIELIGLP